MIDQRLSLLLFHMHFVGVVCPHPPQRFIKISADEADCYKLFTAYYATD